MATAGHHIGEAGSIDVAVLKEEEEGGIKVLHRDLFCSFESSEAYHTSNEPFMKAPT